MHGAWLRTAVLAVLLATLCAARARAAEPQHFNRLESALTIPSLTAPSWDYLALDSQRHQLYIARRDDGILIYDTSAKRLKGTLANTLGGNATTLVPELDRGFVTNEDGSITTFQLSSATTTFAAYAPSERAKKYSPSDKYRPSKGRK